MSPLPIKDQPAPRPELSHNEFYYSEDYLSVQGEGTTAGKLSFFLRLVGCPVQCDFCDTKFTWNPGYESKVADAYVMAQKIKDSGAYQLVLTGGEPLLYSNNEALLHLLALVRNYGVRVEVETSGYKDPGKLLPILVDAWNVSPKLENAIVPTQKWLDSVKFFVGLNSIFKFVVSPETMIRDFEQIFELRKKFDIPKHRIYIMPEGNAFDRQLTSARALIDAVIQAGYSFSLRQHVIIWGSKRGV